jgi:hypothetical protein
MTGVAMDARGDFYVSEKEGNRIRYINMAQFVVSTLAGSLQ